MRGIFFFLCQVLSTKIVISFNPADMPCNLSPKDLREVIVSLRDLVSTTRKVIKTINTAIAILKLTGITILFPPVYLQIKKIESILKYLDMACESLEIFLNSFLVNEGCTFNCQYFFDQVVKAICQRALKDCVLKNARSTLKEYFTDMDEQIDGLTSLLYPVVKDSFSQYFFGSQNQFGKSACSGFGAPLPHSDYGPSCTIS